MFQDHKDRLQGAFPSLKIYGSLQRTLNKYKHAPNMAPVASKGQLISEWLFGVHNFPKKQLKNLKDICPRI